MAFKTGSICSKHDDIKDAADLIRDLADKCMEDGQRMEAGLIEKGKRIDALETENESLREQLEKAEGLIQSLQEENQDLAQQVKVATGEAF